MPNLGSQEEGESNNTQLPLEVFLCRYVADIAKSPENIVDIFPVLFYDRDELDTITFASRFRVATGTVYGNRGFFIAKHRYKKMNEPPLHVPKERGRLEDQIYRINRAYYQSQEFYQTAAYQQMHNFLVGKIKNFYSRK